MLSILVLLACSSSGGGQVSGGDTLVIRLEEIERTSEIRYPGGDGKHYMVTPTSVDNELVMVRLTIWNNEARSVLLTLDAEAAELRGTGIHEAFSPIDVDAVKQEVPEAHVNESKFARPVPGLPGAVPSVLFLLGSVELLKERLLAGWMVFEVPKGTIFRELRWAAGDTVYLRF